MTTQQLVPGTGTPIGTPIVYTTSFAYARDPNQPDQGQTEPLVLRQVQPGGGPGIELDTAYTYDKFGNVATTTSCDNNPTGCQVGAPGSRTTSVSYDPKDFAVPLVNRKPQASDRAVSGQNDQRPRAERIQLV